MNANVRMIKNNNPGFNMKNSKPKSQVPPAICRRRGSTAQMILGTNRNSLALGMDFTSKWGWHYRALLNLRNRLIQEQREHLSRAADPLEMHSMHIGDTGSDEFDHAMALSELSAERDALFEIDEALQRIASGTYGVCEETGQPIPSERLKAVPWTRFAKEVQARHEAKGAFI